MPQNQYGYDPYNMGGMFNTSQNYSYTPPASKPASDGEKPYVADLYKFISGNKPESYFPKIQDYLKNSGLSDWQSKYEEVQNLLKSGMDTTALPTYLAKIFEGAGSGTGLNLEDPNKYFNPELINNYFNLAGRNLSSREANTRGLAQRDAASLAGGRNFLSSDQAVLNAGNQAVAPYAGGFAQLEGQRAGAQESLQQALLNALNYKATAENSDKFNRQNATNQYNLGLMELQNQQNQWQQQLAFQQNQQSPGFWDYFSSLAPLLAAPVSGGTSLLGYAVQPSLWSGKK